jgi:hypothetical protein
MTARDELIEAMAQAIADVDGFGAEFRSGSAAIRELYAKFATAALVAIEDRARIVPKKSKGTPA